MTPRSQDAERVENNKLAEETKANCARRLHNGARSCSVLEIAVSLQLSPSSWWKLSRAGRDFSPTCSRENTSVWISFLGHLLLLYCFFSPPLLEKKNQTFRLFTGCQYNLFITCSEHFVCLWQKSHLPQHYFRLWVKVQCRQKRETTQLANFLFSHMVPPAPFRIKTSNTYRFKYSICI